MGGTSVRPGIALHRRRPENANGGFSLLEVMIASAVFAVAMIGISGLILVTHQHSESSAETMVAYKASQEILEQLQAMTYDQMLAQDGVAFVVTQLHPTQEIGSIEVTDVSEPGLPDTKAEIRVRVQTQAGEITRMALNVELVSWRSRK